MARRLQAYLHKNRAGTFTFRWRPPKAERDRFDRDAYEFSLGTKYRREAWRLAAHATAMAHPLLSVISTMPKPKKKEELFTVKLIRTVVLPNGVKQSVD